MHLNIYQVSALPDLSLIKYAQLGNSDVNSVVDLHGTFLRQLNRMLLIKKIGMHLLYLYDPSKEIHLRLQAYLMWTCEETDGLQLIKDILPHTPLSDYFQFKRITSFSDLSQIPFTHGATMIKRERQVNVIKSDTRIGVDFYSVPSWTPNQNCRLIDTLRMMQALGDASKHPCALRLDIFAADEADAMRTAFQPYLTKLSEMTDRMSSGLLQGVHMLTVRDNNATSTSREYEDWQKKLDTDCHFGMNIYAFASHPAHANMILAALHAEATQAGDCDILPLRIDKAASITERMSPTNTVERYSRIVNQKPLAPHELRAWSTTFTWQECASMFKLPVLFEGEELNMLREGAPVELDSGLDLARTMNGQKIHFPLAHLSKHALICGAPGSGKTNSMLHITTQLWKVHKIPFLVFEPAKKEYRAMFNDPDLKGVYLFSPGIGTAFPLMINPFEFPKGMILSEHLSMLMCIFKGTFETQGPIEYFLDESIQSAYLKKGWQIDTMNDGSLPYPTLQDVYDLLKTEVNKKSYSSENRGNFQAYIEVRFGSLMKRDAGALFNVETSTFLPEEWLKIPAIIEMESLGDAAKNFLTLLLCTLIYESLRISPHKDRDAYPYARHALFIEEAHNLIASQTDQHSEDDINPKISATAFLVKMLAEVRALREAIFIADQLPSILSPEVVKNTGLKIVHRMTSQDDRMHVGSTMNATGDQLSEVSTYGTGKALCYFEGLLKAFKGQICQWHYEKAAPDNSRYVPPLNQQLEQLVYALPDYSQKVLHPYELSCEMRAYHAIKPALDAYKLQSSYLLTIQSKMKLLDKSSSDYRNTSRQYEEELEKCISRKSELTIVLTTLKNLIRKAKHLNLHQLKEDQLVLETLLTLTKP